MINHAFHGDRRRFAVVSASLALAAAGGARAQDDYVLQAGDVVEVAVYQEDSLSRQILIRPDGGMSFPLVGDLHAAGMTPLEVKRELELRLEEYIPQSNVTVSVMQISGNQVFVVGKVNRPGAYPIYRPLDVMQVLALAGGTAQFANVDDIRIIRRDSEGRQRIYEFEYSKVVDGRDLEQNVLVVSGDTIVVP